MLLQLSQNFKSIILANFTKLCTINIKHQISQLSYGQLKCRRPMRIMNNTEQYEAIYSK